MSTRPSPLLPSVVDQLKSEIQTESLRAIVSDFHEEYKEYYDDEKEDGSFKGIARTLCWVGAVLGILFVAPDMYSEWLKTFKLKHELERARLEREMKQ